VGAARRRTRSTTVGPFITEAAPPWAMSREILTHSTSPDPS
jgi:hypothetical protein